MQEGHSSLPVMCWMGIRGFGRRVPECVHSAHVLPSRLKARNSSHVRSPSMSRPSFHPEKCNVCSLSAPQIRKSSSFREVTSTGRHGGRILVVSRGVIGWRQPGGPCGQYRSGFGLFPGWQESLARKSAGSIFRSPPWDRRYQSVEESCVRKDVTRCCERHSFSDVHVSV